MILKLKDLKFSYGRQTILKKISLQHDRGQILTLIGPNGSGKSTLLKCISRILRPDTGKIEIDDKQIGDYKRVELARKLAYVAQHSEQSFSNTVFDTILMGRKPYLAWKARAKDLRIVSNLIEQLDLGNFALRDINKLSGGQRQKVLIARALAQQPELLLLDEPTSDLDLKHQLEIVNILKDLAAAGMSIIITVHDLSLAGIFSDQVVIIKSGRIFTTGGPDIINEKNIEAVYGVRVKVEEYFGNRIIIPNVVDSNFGD